MISTRTKQTISIVIPTYGREQVLLDTISKLLSLRVVADEIIVIDQSSKHDAATADQLESWHQLGTIKIVRLVKPSIPKAMNQGLLHAISERVLFLDDDILAHENLIAAHLAAAETDQQIIAGRVVQPWEKDQGASTAKISQFNSMNKKFINHFMGGNFSINRKKAIELGGFDENFIGVAYHFEKEFADRWLLAGHSIVYEPQAVIDHLKVTAGGTRNYGEHLTTIAPHHALGAYYYYLVSDKVIDKSRAIFKRLIRSIQTRHHLRKPWYIPITLIAELRGLIKARKLLKIGVKHIKH